MAGAEVLETPGTQGPILVPLPPPTTEAIPDPTLLAPPALPPVPDEPPPPAPPTERVAEPWDLYNRAFSASVAGHEDEAIPLLRTLLRDHPDHPAVPHARELLRLIEARLTGASEPRTSPTTLGTATLRPPVRMPAPRSLEDFATRMRADTPSNGGQVTLVLGQTISGIAFGLEVCFIFECKEPALGTLSVLAGAGLGLTLSMVLSSKGVTVGHALSLGVGGVWGFWNAGATAGLLMSGSVLPDGGRISLPFSLAMGQVIGTLVGELAYQVAKPGDGDIWAATSTAAWAISVTLLVSAAVNPRGGLVLVPETIIAGDLGLLLGGIFAMVMPMGSGRVWVINAGGLLGALAGVIVSAVIVPVAIASGASANTGNILAGSTAGGIVLGLGLTAFLTRHMDVPNLASPQFTLMATSTGGVTPGISIKL